MFSSPCTLRSASCAALIALATAAGIVRVPEAAAIDRGGRRPCHHTEFIHASRHSTHDVATTFRDNRKEKNQEPGASLTALAMSVSHPPPPEPDAFPAISSPQINVGRLAWRQASLPVGAETRQALPRRLARHLLPFAVGPPAL